MSTSVGLRQLLGNRYRGSAEPKLPAVVAPSIESLLAHRSVRSYVQKPLPSGTIELLIAAAQSAASSSNLQLWSAIEVEDAGRRRELAAVAGGQSHVEQSAAFLVWLADLSRPTTIARALGIEPEALDFFEMFLMASVDAALAAQNAVVAAEAQGLSTVFIGAIRNRPEAVAQILGLPERVFALFGLCVGYADQEKPVAIKPRLPQSVVLSRDRYRALSPERISDYDRAMSAFYAEQQMDVPAGGWSVHSARRVQNAAALNGRHRLLETLRALGFGLR